MRKLDQVFIEENDWGFRIFGLNEPQKELMNQMAQRMHAKDIVVFMNDFFVSATAYLGKPNENIHSYINNIPRRNASFLVPSPILLTLEWATSASLICNTAITYKSAYFRVMFNKEAIGDDIPLLMLEYSGYDYEEFP